MRSGDTRDLKALAVGTNAGADGGYAVPKEINAAIESILLRQSPIRRYSSVIQATTGDYHKLVSDRGWAQGWAAETAARTATNTAKLTDIKVPLFEQYAFPQATQVMLDDVFFDAGAWIANEIGLIFAERESNAFMVGDGTTMPAGILAAPTAATADYSTRPQGTLEYLPTGAASTFITGTASVSPVDVLVDCIAHMKPGYRANGQAQWFMHPTTLAFLAKVKDQQGRFIVVPNLEAGQPQTLLGYEVVECEHMPLIGTNAFPVMFANLKRGYIVVDRPGVGVLRDPFTNKPYVGFYSTARVGGQVVNSEAIKLVKCAVS
jgi:HK97 family phage major capsid protein